MVRLFSLLSFHFFFLSNLGMTDWGSHGAGDDSETETPLLIWGSGIRSSRHTNVHIEQADLCPLMSYFLGLDYSINSVGRLPIDYLLPIDEDLLQAYLQNARQLLEQVHQQHDELKKRLWIFKPYELNEEKFFAKMQTSEGYMNIYQIKDDIKDFMEHVSFASHYYHTYRRFLLSILITLDFCLVISTIAYQLSQKQLPSTLIGSICKIIPLFIACLLFIEQSPWTYLLYPILLGVHAWISSDYLIYILKDKVFKQIKSINFWMKLFMIGICLQLFILPFFYRWTMSIGVFALFLDGIRRSRYFYYTRLRFTYGLCLILISIFPFLPTLGTIKMTLSWCTILSGLLIFSFHYLYFQNDHEQIHLYRLQRFCLILAMINNYLVHSLGFRSTFLHILSWLIVILSSMIPLCSLSKYRFKRLILIYTSILIVYILLSTQYEALFLLCLCSLMITWILTFEQHQQQTDYLWFLTLQSFLFILLAFFGTGNFASINSFDPSIVYCFLTIFSPFLMTSIILLKCILPILIVTCATIYLLKNIEHIRIFRLYTLILSDILALELFFSIRTYGSWLDIGESISRYVILMIMIVIIIGFHFLSSLLLNKQIKWADLRRRQDRL